MKLGYSPTTAAILNLDEAFKLAVELELHFVELAWELSEIVPQLQSEAQVRELSRATGVGTTMHLPFVDLNLASLIPAARMVAVERVQRAIDFAAAVGSSCG
ncbi:MAG: sugar phosphate isomerase/epimerase, partial [Truepera sp.]|nr:sugar phosphate isomerase/epimerase [Truepera sp.]